MFRQNHPDDLGKISEIQRQLSQLVATGQNLAELVRASRANLTLPTKNLSGLIHQILVLDHTYAFLSGNLGVDRGYISTLPISLFNQKIFDTVLVIFQSDGNVEMINPAWVDPWDSLDQKQIGNLVVTYAKRKPDATDHSLTVERHLSTIIQAICGNAVRSHSHIKTNTTTKTRVNFNVTPKYAVPVSNDAFHHGNVEAWQNIFESYYQKHSHHTIQIFHRNKPVRRITSLFEWGRVRSGENLYFSIAGKTFEDTAKLKKYLTLASSVNYKMFIKKETNSILNLF